MINVTNIIDHRALLISNKLENTINKAHDQRTHVISVYDALWSTLEVDVILDDIISQLQIDIKTIYNRNQM